MPLWNRLNPQSLGTIKQVSQSEGPASVLLSNPHSDQFDEGGIYKPKDLVNYLIALEVKKFGKAIIGSLSFTALQHHAKQLMEKYEVGELKRAVKIAVDTSNHPCSFKLVEEICINQRK
jgi:hypothetical protein